MIALKTIAIDTFSKTLQKMKPEKLVSSVVKVDGNVLFIDDHKINTADFGGVWVIGAGKAAARMATGFEAAAGHFIKDGLVIAPKNSISTAKKIQILPGSHPKPDEDSIASTLELLSFVDSIPQKATVIVLISGGASSLMETPADGLNLEEVRETYEIILKSGASIHEMNLIRKHLSAVKGGKLLRRLAGRNVINIMLSDVPGDDPNHIGSGSTYPDFTTRKDAFKIVEKYQLESKLPKAVVSMLQGSDQEGFDQYPETKTILAGTSLLFAEEAAHQLKEIGFTPVVLPESYNLPVETIAEIISDEIKKYKKGKYALLFHGESTVEVTGTGKGGRNQHLALLVAEKSSGNTGFILLSAGTDGGDGPTDAAGAVIDGSTIDRAKSMGLDVTKSIANFDAYHFFKSLDDLIFSGPTGNNLMDFQMVLIDR